MKVYIFANCQGRSLIPILNKAGITDISHNHNYYYIHDQTLSEEIKTYLETCDIFIYQPLSKQYPIYNTDNLKKYLKPSCISISFPYIYNDALIPLYITQARDMINDDTTEYHTNLVYGNSDVIISLKKQGLSLQEIFNLYDTDKINFNYENRMNKSLSIFKKKEETTDIKISNFIEKNYKNYKLFNYHKDEITYCNHPANVLLNECANQILKILGIPPITYEGEEIINGDHIVSRYDINYYKFNWINEPSPGADDFFKKLIQFTYDLVN